MFGQCRHATQTEGRESSICVEGTRKLPRVPAVGWVSAADKLAPPYVRRAFRETCCHACILYARQPLSAALKGERALLHFQSSLPLCLGFAIFPLPSGPLSWVDSCAVMYGVWERRLCPWVKLF
jgi:hypothetical protein